MKPLMHYVSVSPYLDSFYRKSAELVEALLKLSDLGHYQQVSELFKFPVQHCPDLLVINLLQTSVSFLLFINDEYCG